MCGLLQLPHESNERLNRSQNNQLTNSFIAFIQQPDTSPPPHSQILDEFMDVLIRDRSPVCGHNSAPTQTASNTNNTTTTSANNSTTTNTTSTPRNNQILEGSIQRNLTNFSLITHGFGTPAIMAALNVVRAYLNESMKIIDRQHPSIGSLSSSQTANHQQQHHHQHHPHHHQHHHHHQSITNHLSNHQHLSNGILNDSNSNSTTSSLHKHLHNQAAYQHSALVEPKKEIV